MKKVFIISLLLISGLFIVFQGCSSKLSSVTEPVIYATATPFLSAVSTATSTRTVFIPVATNTITLTPTTCCAAFPDLRVTGISSITMHPVPSCVPSGGPYPAMGIHVYYENTGAGASAPFTINIDGYTNTAPALAAYTSGQVWVPVGYIPGSVTVTLDPANLIYESNETNNTYSGVVAIPTLPFTCGVPITFTPTRTSTFTATPTKTPTCACIISTTPTLTPTPSGALCYDPSIRVANIFSPAMTEFSAGNIIAANFYTHVPGQQLKVAYYDGSKTLLQAMNYTADGSGYSVGVTYTVTGLETKTTDSTKTWIVALMDASGTAPATYAAGAFIDSEEIWVVTGAPMPTPTMACTNTGMTYMNPSRTIEKYDFNLDNCEWIYYANRQCNQDAQVLYYDGAGALVNSEACACVGGNLVSQYNITGTETQGAWSILLYKTGFTPPATPPPYSDPNRIANCTNVGMNRTVKVLAR